MTNLEGRVILRRRVRPPPPGVKTDIEILCALAERLGDGDALRVRLAREEVFDELRRATAGGKADYSGITYERIDARAAACSGPAPREDHPGTPRLFAERFAHPDGKARFHACAHRPAAELPDAEYPLYFTTGRYKEHYNSGAQTRRVAALVDAKPEPRAADPPAPGRAARASPTAAACCVESRRGEVDVRGRPSAPDIRPDTLFAPFHWGGKQRRQHPDQPRARPDQPDARVQGLRRARRAARRRSTAGDRERRRLSVRKKTPGDRRQRHGHLPPARRAGRATARSTATRSPCSARSRAAPTTASCSAGCSAARRPTRSSPSRRAGTTAHGIRLHRRRASSSGSTPPPSSVETADGARAPLRRRGARHRQPAARAAARRA